MLHSVPRNQTYPVIWQRSVGAVTTLRRSQKFGLFLASGLFLGAAEPSALARPGLGYGDLIDKYCIERGRLRVGAHQGHCAACHRQGTFDSVPEHRVEPNWTQFERGRTTGLFDFFCPPVQVPAAAPGPQPPVGGSAIASPELPAPMGKPPATPRSTQAQPPQPPSTGPAQPQVKAAPAAETYELSGRLASLHDAVRIQPPQEPAWRELVDALAAATRREPSAVATGTTTARLKALERDFSERIVALRALDLALSRLAAQLDETQRRSLSDGLTPLLDGMR